MEIKKLMMMVVLGSSLALITGCGIAVEEYNAKLADLEKVENENQELKKIIANERGRVKDEEAKFRAASIRLDEVEAKKIDLEKQMSEANKQLADANMATEEIESKMSELKRAVDSSSRAKSKVEGEYKELAKEYAHLLEKYNQYRNNMIQLNQITGSRPAKEVTPRPAVVKKPVKPKKVATKKAPRPVKKAAPIVKTKPVADQIQTMLDSMSRM